MVMPRSLHSEPAKDAGAPVEMTNRASRWELRGHGAQHVVHLRAAAKAETRENRGAWR